MASNATSLLASLERHMKFGNLSSTSDLTFPTLLLVGVAASFDYFGRLVVILGVMLPEGEEGVIAFFMESHRYSPSILFQLRMMWVGLFLLALIYFLISLKGSGKSRQFNLAINGIMCTLALLNFVGTWSVQQFSEYWSGERELNEMFFISQDAKELILDREQNSTPIFFIKED